MKKVWIPVVVACLLGLLSAMVGIGMAIGYLPYADVALAGAFYIGIPLTLVSLLLLALPRVRRTWVPGIGLGMAAYFLVLMATASFADRTKRGYLEEAAEFCTSLLPRLEEYKSVYGTYPASIQAVLLPTDSLPLYLRQQTFYFPRGNAFTFEWKDSPEIAYCSGEAIYHHPQGEWDICACWGI